MTKHHLKYGKSVLEVELDQRRVQGVLVPKENPYSMDQNASIIAALNDPIGTKRLEDIVVPGEQVVIITSDITRPMPSRLVLPILLDRLKLAGIRESDITVVFALGSHRKHTREEIISLVGEDVFRKIVCLDSNETDCVHLGTTTSGTPVNIYRPVATADRRICIGNIDYHYFAGYSGGAKAIMPGVSTREAIQVNHSKMVDDMAKTGELDRNPVRQDLEEAIQFVPIDFILNVILDEKKKVIKAVAGHFIKAHREGCKFLDSIYKCPIKNQVDLVIVSPGGYPKDINMYQAQKALDNAKHAVKPGGMILWVASCIEGYGEKTFERWITEASTPDSMVERIQSDFELGGHKAAAIAMVLEKCRVLLVSDMPDEMVKAAFLEPFNDLATAMDTAVKHIGKDGTILLMPYGGSTLPVIENE